MPTGVHKITTGETKVCRLKGCGKQFTVKQLHQKYCCRYHRIYACQLRGWMKAAMQTLEEGLTTRVAPKSQ